MASSIVWLTISNPIRSVRHLSNHFVLKVHDKFMVLTSNPPKGVASYVISNVNIEGEAKTQFIVDKVHTMGSNYMIRTVDKANNFLANHGNEFHPWVNKIQETIT